MPTPPTNLAAAYDDALERFNGDNVSDLDDVDKVLVTIWGLEADVNNGGFDQYYFNSSGNQALWAPVALRTRSVPTRRLILSRERTLSSVVKDGVR